MKGLIVLLVVILLFVFEYWKNSMASREQITKLDRNFGTNALIFLVVVAVIGGIVAFIWEAGREKSGQNLLILICVLILIIWFIPIKVAFIESLPLLLVSVLPKDEQYSKEGVPGMIMGMVVWVLTIGFAIAVTYQQPAGMLEENYWSYNAVNGVVVFIWSCCWAVYVFNKR